MKRYAAAPVGNAPEIMPLDCSLNYVLHSSVSKHVVLAKHLAKNHPDKFSISTPKVGEISHRRLWNYDIDTNNQDTGAPTGKAIVKDINRAIKHATIIVHQKGIIVPGLGNRKRRRHVEVGRSNNRKLN